MAGDQFELAKGAGHEVDSTGEASIDDGPITRPRGWEYKSVTVGRLQLPWYASPPVQLVLVAFVCFLCPGMFNALGGMGGGGQIDTSAADKANTALYSTFAVVGFFAGTVVNAIGVKLALSFGGLGYCVYIASFLCYSHTKNEGFNIFAGALLGVCAGILWSAQGAIMLSYPSEDLKGRYISWFWMIFNLGGVIGSLIPLAQNINAADNSVVSDGTYIGFIVLTGLGAVIAFLLVDAKKVIRADGSRIILMKNPTWKTEIYGLWETLLSDPYIVLLFPMFFASNWFYTYQFNGVNLAYFNTRTRALNNTLYWSSQIVGAFVFGYALDIKSVRRTVRAKVVWVVLFVFTMILWGCGYDFQRTYTRDQVSLPTYIKKDWTDAGYVGPMFLYIFYGVYDAAWQTCVYWYMGSLTNNGRKLANFAGFYKGIQSAGAAIMWRMDGVKIPYMSEFGSCWGLLLGSLLLAAPVILARVKDHSNLQDDLALTDEKEEDVVGHGGTVAPSSVHEIS